MSDVSHMAELVLVERAADSYNRFPLLLEFQLVGQVPFSFFSILWRYE